MMNIIQTGGKQLNIAGVTPIKLFDSLQSLAASTTSTGVIGSSRTGMVGESLTSISSLAPSVVGYSINLQSVHGIPRLCVCGR